MKTVEQDWLNEFNKVKQWKLGMTVPELRKTFSETRCIVGINNNYQLGNKYMLFGESANIFFMFSNEETLYRVTIQWDSFNSGAYALSKFQQIKTILDEKFGQSNASPSSAHWFVKGESIELGITEDEYCLVMQFGNKDT